MKTILASLLLLLGLSAFGQTAVRSLNGNATNLNLRGETTNHNNMYLRGTTEFGPNDTANWSLSRGGDDLVLTDNISGKDFRFNASGVLEVLSIVGNGFTGNGAGLTNLTFPATQVYNFSGKATFVQTNVTFKVIDFTTNSVVAGGATIAVDLLKSYSAFATNANFAIDGLSGKITGATNIQSANIFITNSAAAAITCTMNAQFQNMNASEGNTLYVTNVGHLLVFHYPGFGTNFYFKSR